MSASPTWSWLAAALVISVAAHGAGAWWLWRRPPALVRPAEVAAEAGAPVEVQVLGATTLAAARIPAPVRREPLAPGPRLPPARTVDPVTTESPAGEPPATSEEVPGLAAEPGAAAGDGAKAVRAPAAAPGPAAGRGVPAALASRLAAAALRCYPASAVRFRLRGEALLAFCLGEDGVARSSGLVRSSGSPLLDRAALECVLPGALPVPGAAGCYELPVRFARD